MQNGSRKRLGCIILSFIINIKFVYHILIWFYIRLMKFVIISIVIIDNKIENEILSMITNHTYEVSPLSSIISRGVVQKEFFFVLFSGIFFFIVRRIVNMNL